MIAIDILETLNIAIWFFLLVSLIACMAMLFMHLSPKTTSGRFRRYIQKAVKDRNLWVPGVENGLLRPFLYTIYTNPKDRKDILCSLIYHNHMPRQFEHVRIPATDNGEMQVLATAMYHLDADVLDKVLEKTFN